MHLVYAQESLEPWWSRLFELIQLGKKSLVRVWFNCILVGLRLIVSIGLG